MEESTRQALSDSRSDYSPDQKVLIALCWLQTRSNKAAAKAAKEQGVEVPAETIRKWRQRGTFWETAIAEARKILDVGLGEQFVYIQQASVSQIIDRLENGDEHVTKDGEKIRRQIPAKELVQIAKAATEGRAMCEGTEGGAASGEERALNRIADKLREIAQQQRQGETFDGEVVVISEETEEAKGLPMLRRPSPDRG